MVGTPTTA